MQGFTDEWLEKLLQKGEVEIVGDTKLYRGEDFKVEVRAGKCASEHNPWQPQVIQADKVVFSDIRIPGKLAGWTKTETDFARDVLEPMLERGEIVFWTDQMEFRLPGQTYTADFVAMGSGGEWLVYEVKGSYALGSQGRSSVKLRWALDHLDKFASVQMFWCKQRKDGTFAIKRVVNGRRKHAMLKAKPT